LKKVKYIGDYDADLPTLGIAVVPGDVIEVEDTFESVLFLLVVGEVTVEYDETLKGLSSDKLKGDI